CVFTHFVFTFLSNLGVLPSGGVHGARPNSVETAQVLTALFLEGLLLMNFGVALVAYYANRHLPGFLPRSRPDTQVESRGTSTVPLLLAVGLIARFAADVAA